MQVCQMEKHELGEVLPERDVEEVLQQLYGDTRTRPALFADSAAQLHSEALGPPGSRPPVAPAIAMAPAPARAKQVGPRMVSADGFVNDT